MLKRYRLRAIFSVLAVATASLALAGAAGASSGGGVVIEAQDACDPVTFGPDLCTRTDSSGKRMTIDEAFARLSARGALGAWRFTHDDVKVKAGQPVVAQMGRGGEFHSFTEVTDTGFTLGCVPDLNEPVFHTRDVNPTCGDIDPATGAPVVFLQTGLAPGRTIPVDTSTRGTHLFQCFIHPWMRATVTVE